MSEGVGEGLAGLHVGVGHSCSTVQPQPVQPLQVWNNVARVNLGVGFYNSGWYNCYYGYYYGTCTSGSYTSYVPFLVGPQIDLGLSRASALSVGVTYKF